MKTLDALRQDIDAIDDILVESIAKRRAIVAEVGEYKKEHNIPIIDPKREEKKLRTLLEKGDVFGIPESVISQIWKILYNDAYTVEK